MLSNLVHIFTQLCQEVVFEIISFGNIVSGFRCLRNDVSCNAADTRLMEFPKSHGIGQLLPIYIIHILDRQVNCMLNLGKVIFRTTAPHTAPHRPQSRLINRGLL